MGQNEVIFEFAKSAKAKADVLNILERVKVIFDLCTAISKAKGATSQTMMEENIIKAHQCAQLLDSDLQQIYKDATEDEALTILCEQLIETNCKVVNILARLEGKWREKNE